MRDRPGFTLPDICRNASRPETRAGRPASGFAGVPVPEEGGRRRLRELERTYGPLRTGFKREWVPLHFPMISIFASFGYDICRVNAKSSATSFVLHIGVTCPIRKCTMRPLNNCCRSKRNPIPGSSRGRVRGRPDQKQTWRRARHSKIPRRRCARQSRGTSRTRSARRSRRI